MFDFIKKINPPGMDRPGMHGRAGSGASDQPGRLKLYKLIGALGARMVEDLWTAFRAFFPFLATPRQLEAHSRALSIPRFASDTEEDFRHRVSRAAFFLQNRGRVVTIRDFLESLFPYRYRLREYPREGFKLGASKLGEAPLGCGCRLFIYVQQLTAQEQEFIYDYLNATLAPDIEINILEDLING